MCEHIWKFKTSGIKMDTKHLNLNIFGDFRVDYVGARPVLSDSEVIFGRMEVEGGKLLGIKR